MLRNRPTEAFYPIWCWSLECVGRTRKLLTRTLRRGVVAGAAHVYASNMAQLILPMHLAGDCCSGSGPWDQPGHLVSNANHCAYADPVNMRIARHWISAVNPLTTKIAAMTRIHDLSSHNVIDPNSVVSAHGDMLVTTHAAWLEANNYTMRGVSTATPCQ